MQLAKHIWLWGGPTKQWGGTMEKDCVVRGADYFGARNVMYVYGPHTDEWLEPLKKYDRVFCHLGNNCRNPEDKRDDIVEEARELSRIALRYPNIAGAIVDDFIQPKKPVSPEKIREMHEALNEHRKDLLLAGVFYTHMDNTVVRPLLPFLDVVTLWVWASTDLPKLDDLMRQAKKDFPGKTMYMGVFINDYGVTADTGGGSQGTSATSVEMLELQLDRIRGYIADDQLQGAIILGDREIKKHPEASAFVRDYLREHFAK
jgi:hypothetical protein